MHPRVVGVLRAGDPKHEILDAIVELGPDLVVMGTNGRNSLARKLLGSVAERVALTVRAPGEAYERLAI